MKDRPSGGQPKPASRWVAEAARAKEAAMQRRQQNAAERAFLRGPNGDRPLPDRFAAPPPRTPRPGATKPNGKGAVRRKR